MKALLYKDLCLIRKQMRVFLLVILLLLLFPLHIFWTAVNISLAPLVGLMVPLQLAMYDEKSRWNHYARHLPYTPRDLVLSRYLAGWGSTLLGTALGLGATALLSPNHQVSPESLLALGWLVAGVLAAQAVEFPLLARGTVIHGYAWSLAILLTTLVLVFSLLGLANENDPWSAFLQLLPVLVRATPLVLLAAAAANAASVPVTLRRMKAEWP